MNSEQSLRGNMNLFDPIRNQVFCDGNIYSFESFQELYPLAEIQPLESERVRIQPLESEKVTALAITWLLKSLSIETRKQLFQALTSNVCFKCGSDISKSIVIGDCKYCRGTGDQNREVKT